MGSPYSDLAWGFGRSKFQHEPMFYAYVAGRRPDRFTVID